MKYTVDIWERCYSKGWTGILTPDSFRHPAKVAFGLAERIYQHVREEGWATPGDTIIDPFGGIGGFAFHAMHARLNFVGVELEERFVELAAANIEEWRRRYGHLPTFGTARIIQGDSRRLSAVIREAGLAVSSPPYAQGLGNANEYRDEGRAQDDASRDIMRVKAGKAADARYSPDPSNLGNLPASEAGFSAAVSSPPYVDSVNAEGHGIDWTKAGPATGNRKRVGSKCDETLRALNYKSVVVSSPPYVESLSSDDPEKRGGLFRDPKRKNDKTLTATYGESDGQLGAMKEGAFDVAVSSPPFVDARQNTTASVKGTTAPTAHDPEAFGTSTGQLGAMRESKDGFDLSVSSPPYEGNEKHDYQMSEDGKTRRRDLGRDHKQGHGCFRGNYGETEGQLAREVADDFWSAAKQILEQTYLVLAPGAHAVWVLKGFVRKGKYVDFPDQWRQLCEAVGFETVHWHNASLIEHSATQTRFDGDEDKVEVQRKSFFRRLAENNGSPRIDFEIVLCTRKPGEN